MKKDGKAHPRFGITRIGLAMVVASGFLAGSAHASPTKQQCGGASNEANELVKQLKLVEARRSLFVCLDSSCPEVVRENCSEIAKMLDRDMPTIVFAVKDHEGHDVTTARITMDGTLIKEQLDGKAAEVNPGEHTFRIEIVGQRVPVERKLVAVQGEKNRQEMVSLNRPETPHPPTQAKTPLAPPEAKTPSAQPRSPGNVSTVSPLGPPDIRRTQREQASGGSAAKPIGYAAVAIGAAAAVVGGLLAVTSAAAATTAKNRFVSATTGPDWDSAKEDFGAAKSRNQLGWTIAGVGGGVLLAGIIAAITGGESSTSRTASLTPWLEGSRSAGVRIETSW